MLSNHLWRCLGMNESQLYEWKASLLRSNRRACSLSPLDSLSFESDLLARIARRHARAYCGLRVARCFVRSSTAASLPHGITHSMVNLARISRDSLGLTQFNFDRWRDRIVGIWIFGIFLFNEILVFKMWHFSESLAQTSKWISPAEALV